MPIETIRFQDQEYPHFQSTGFAAKYAFPFAKEICNGTGFDIGFSKKEWALPGAIPIDKAMPDEWEAMNLPDIEVDYIFSSHCLEHINDWVRVLDYWTSKIKSGGVLFLYLPHPDQRYWLPWNNRKHISVLYPHLIKDYMINNGYYKVFVSERDLNHSFIAIGEKI